METWHPRRAAPRVEIQVSILSADTARFGADVPVAIVGGGACGLVAALASEAGAAPLVLEQSATCHGSSGMSLGALCAAGTAEQRRHGVEDDAQALLGDILAKTGGGADPVAARLVAERSGPVVDWLADAHDVVFGLDAGWRPAFGHSRARLHATPERTGADMMARLAGACDRAGMDVLTEARVVDLFVDDDGRVASVRVARPDGTREDVGARTLVLATCGFGGSPELIAEHIPAMREARYVGWEGNQGDGVAWGRALGAATRDMNAYQGLGLLAEPQGLDVNPKFLLQGGVQVNSLGERFSDELDDVSGQGARVIAQPGAVSWLVYDERIHHACADLRQYRDRLALEGAAERRGDRDAERQALGAGHLRHGRDLLHMVSAIAAPWLRRLKVSEATPTRFTSSTPASSARSSPRGFSTSPISGRPAPAGPGRRRGQS